MNPVKDPASRVRDWVTTSGRTVKSFTLRTVTADKVAKALNKLKPSKTLHSDDIDGYGLHLVAPVLLPAICHVVNLSHDSGVFVKVWKQAIIHPHHKKEERDKLDNYRPVSNTVKMGLLTEHIAHDQIVEHFSGNNLFDIIDKPNLLSIHQLTCMNIIQTALKIISSTKLKYLALKLTENAVRGRNTDKFYVQRLRLNISNEGFINQAA